MSGLRKCAECDGLFRIDDDGPEPMRRDGTFPRHVCGRCNYLMDVLEGLRELGKTQFLKTGAGVVGHVVVPHEGAEAHVLSIRWKDKETLTADVAEEESGKILHDAVEFKRGFEEPIAPLLDLL